MTDEPNYDHWYSVLDGEKPSITNEPQPGYYRLKDGRPVAIWFEDGSVVNGDHGIMIAVSDVLIPRTEHEDLWLRCAMNAVEEDDYRAVIDGGVWPDMDAVILETIGHNIAGANDPETIKALIDTLATAAIRYNPIEDDLMAERAQSLRSRALELRKKADDIRETEKKPHLEAGKAVDAKWQPLVKSGQTVADILRGAMSAYETKKALAARKAEEERRALEAANVSPSDKSEPVTTPAPASTQIKGGYGRAASKQVVKKVSSIESVTTLANWLHNHEPQTFIDFILERAQRAVSNGYTPAGVTIVEEVSVR